MDPNRVGVFGRKGRQHRLKNKPKGLKLVFAMLSEAWRSFSRWSASPIQASPRGFSGEYRVRLKVT